MHSFISTVYKVIAQSDRMDYWLLGEPFKKRKGISGIIAAGISIGTLQVPVDGQLIIQMADCHISNCYARVANVITSGLTLLEQMRPGVIRKKKYSDFGKMKSSRI